MADAGARAGFAINRKPLGVLRAVLRGRRGLLWNPTQQMQRTGGDWKGGGFSGCLSVSGNESGGVRGLDGVCGRNGRLISPRMSELRGGRSLRTRPSYETLPEVALCVL